MPTGPATGPDSLPEQFGPYHILQRLGKGGMGTVYLARDTRLNRNVALKVCHLSSHTHPQALERFTREARAAAALQHPNLCRVYDVGEIDGVRYLTMEYVEGPTLAEWKGGRRPLPQEEAAALVAKLALAMQEAHKAGVIHRDLKPANIKINSCEQPVILDFGLAHLKGTHSTRLTQEGEILGTPAYMAPEQVTGEIGQHGPGCDIYSLGVILYELLTGRLPFEGPTAAVLGQVLNAEPAPPSTHRPDLDRRLDGVCLKAMARRATGRQETMADLAAGLNEILNTGIRSVTPPALASNAVTGVLASPPNAPVAPSVMSSLPSGAPQPARGHLRRRRWVTVGLSLAVVAIVVVVIGLIYHRVRPVENNLPTPPLAKEITNSVSMKFVLVPADKFWMGSPNGEIGRDMKEEKQREVEISRPFYMGIYEVTQKEWEKVMGKHNNPSAFSPAGGAKDKVQGLDTSRYPVERVSWYKAREFCSKLSELPDEKQAGRTYRLPTEEEWEYASRGGSQESAPFNIDGEAAFSLSSDRANFDGSKPYGDAPAGKHWGRTVEVGSYRPNGFGLFDMHGNVSEWCQDQYEKGPQDRLPVGGVRILRGGHWGDRGQNCRSAHRHWVPPDQPGHYTGFRVVCIIDAVTP